MTDFDKINLYIDELYKDSTDMLETMKENEEHYTNEYHEQQGIDDILYLIVRKLDKMTRLNIIKELGNFSTCQKCRFTYIAMSMLAEKHCPRCEKYIFESDSEYLENEEKTIEEISQENIFDADILTNNLRGIK